MGTRQEIVDYLESHPFASAEDLAELLSKTRANIQYHLKQLEKSGNISPVVPSSKTVERGRPRRYFSLAATDRPNNLVQFIHVLLTVLNQGSLDKESIYKQAASTLVNIHSSPSSGTPRLNRLVKELNSRGYQARWEAHAAGPEIIFRNCPYAALLPEHPELCQIDTFMLETNLGIPFLQRTRFHLPAVPACHFVKKNS